MRTLRFYDQIGLFTSSGHTQSGHRLYDESDLSRLQQIVSLKEMGLSLEEVKSSDTFRRRYNADSIKHDTTSHKCAYLSISNI